MKAYQLVICRCALQGVLSLTLYASLLVVSDVVCICPFQACRKTCFQYHLMEECQCYSARFPFGDNIVAYKSIDVAGMQPCESDSLTKQERGAYTKT